MEDKYSNEISVKVVNLTKLVKLDHSLRKAMLYLRICAAVLIFAPFLNEQYISMFDFYFFSEEIMFVSFLFGIIFFLFAWPVGRKFRFAYTWPTLPIVLFLSFYIVIVLSSLIEDTWGYAEIVKYSIVAALLYLSIPVFIGLISGWLVRRMKPIEGQINSLECLRFQTRSTPISWTPKKLLLAAFYYSLPIFVFAIGAIVGVVLSLEENVTIILALVVSIGSGIWSWDRAKRVRQMTVEEVRKHDKRAPMLLLRSFKDDMLNIEPPLLSKKLVKGTSFEEVITEQLWVEGPVIAIGRPGEGVPPVGAARSYYTDDEWQLKAEEMVSESKAVAMIVGTTEGLGWEIRRIVSFDLLRKLLLIFPPVPKKESDDRWTLFQSHTGNERLNSAFKTTSPQKLMVLSFLNDNQLVAFITSKKRNPLAYHLALAASAQLLPDTVLKPENDFDQELAVSN